MRKPLLGVVALWVSFAVQAGEITLYTRANFGGPAIKLHESEPDLDKLGFNDRTSSVVVSSGRWQVCEHKQYKGRCKLLEKGEYAQLKDFNNMMSSVRELDELAQNTGKSDRP
ncbi:beta/gamma crystallin family protein [Duganella qianjiadongensis]|uniref:Beta/gamma crystallin 'Greek key' domain-containing protein n=1 Tax=Duganella qianjiadongensis TaxID=2692176 RepID=A0ABW9VKD4_9BURK|nr:beta/gamma crystallin family protein [Duganella qianjiadongensis]MYM40063.1 hypothetical protein [Duganella qianjiadongensis]